jgi:hypothetical protein
MSLAIAMIYGEQAFLATDRRVTLLDESGNNTNIQHEKNKLHKIGLTYFTAMGVEPCLISKFPRGIRLFFREVTLRLAMTYAPR